MNVNTFANSRVPQIRFAVDEIRDAVQARQGAFSLSELSALAPSEGISLAIACGTAEVACLVEALELKPLPHPQREAYSIRVAGATIAVLSGDPVGAMYGGLDLAESVRAGALQSLNNCDHSPAVARRGIKFNIPLDARTPSYSDASDSAQHNIPVMWQTEFWREFLDEMARDRFNVLTLWSLHPFPSMVWVPEFPDVALDDVMRTTVALDDSYSLCGHDMVREETLKHLETVKRISMDDKIRFWREVMQFAHDRGIECYLFTWNIFTFGADGKYDITHEQDNPRTIAYFRASVREMVLTYPLLAGIGITAGERMANRDDEFDKERWLWQAYGEGIRDALRQEPSRKFRLIHRYYQTGLDSIREAWHDYPGPFDLSYKYAIAHMYSAPAPPFARDALAHLPQDLRMWMTVRNDDIYSFRWGDPDYARDFINALPGPDKLAGYYMGPDGFTWGREFTSREPQQPRQLVIHKHWFSFLLWGRLSYEPSLTNAHFERILAARFPAIDGRRLFEALMQSSRIIPLVTRFHWEDLDFQWFPEACMSHRRRYKGFHTVRHFMEGPTMRESGLVSIRDYCAAVTQGRAVHENSPFQVAQQLRAHATRSLEGAGAIDAAADKEVRLMLGDITAMAHLGTYYAAKIEGATHLALFETSGDEQRRHRAIRCLEEALGHWRTYAATASRQYLPQLLTRIGMVDLEELTRHVEADIITWRSQYQTG